MKKTILVSSLIALCITGCKKENDFGDTAANLMSGRWYLRAYTEETFTKQNSTTNVKDFYKDMKEFDKDDYVEYLSNGVYHFSTGEKQCDTIVGNLSEKYGKWSLKNSNTMLVTVYQPSGDTVSGEIHIGKLTKDEYVITTKAEDESIRVIVNSTYRHE